MRFVKVSVPEGQSQNIVEMAQATGITKVSVYQVQVYEINQPQAIQEVIELETATPKAGTFVDSLMAAPFFDPKLYTVAVWHPRSIVGSEPPERETQPIVVPTADAWEELWQFCHITRSLIGRVFAAALLLAYGMIEMNVPIMIAALLFLPYHHQMLAIGLGAWTQEWGLVKKGALVLIVTTALIIAAGACAALFLEPPLRFNEFGSLTSGFIIAFIIGIAAGLAVADDAGRRELIGLAATAHITVLPAWLGISFVFGFPEESKITERLLTFGVTVSTLIAAAVGAYALLGLKGGGVRRFTKLTSDRQ
jgi:hypothetical protein